MKRSVSTFIVAVLLVAALVYGVIHLFSLRFSQGDVYPAYSTLRTDPLGAKAFYDALDGIPQLRVQRNYRFLSQQEMAPSTTLFLIGVEHSSSWSEVELTHLEMFMAAGGRVVIALAPAGPVPSRKSGNGDSQESTAIQRQHRINEISWSALRTRWDFATKRVTDEQEYQHQTNAHRTGPIESLERELPYRSALRFMEPGSRWRVLYTVKWEPVVMARRWGRGSLVLAGDSFFLSNEALQSKRCPGLLSWLIEDARDVIFDEKHHGIHEKSGIVSLIRKYGLQSAVVSLIIVAVLWIWMQSAPLVPFRARGETAIEDTIIGRDSAEGMADLLRRFIPPGKILEVCIDEWRKTYVHQPEAIARLHQSLEEIPPALRKRDPVQAYRALAAMLATKRPSRFP